METGFVYLYFPFFLAVHSSSPLSFNHDGSLQYCMIVFKERNKQEWNNNNNNKTLVSRKYKWS